MNNSLFAVNQFVAFISFKVMRILRQRLKRLRDVHEERGFMIQGKISANNAPGIFFRLAENWSAILLATVLCASVLFTYGKFVMTPQFTSTAVLYTLNGNTAELSEGQLETSLAGDCAYAAGSQEVLSKVISDKTLSYTYREMADKIQVEYPEGTHVVEITVTDKSSKSAKELVDAVADATVSYVSREMGIGTARVLSYGFTGGKTVTISPTKLAVVGALAGFILSVFAFLYRAFRDDRILVPGDLKSAGLEVFAMVPSEE